MHIFAFHDSARLDRSSIHTMRRTQHRIYLSHDLRDGWRPVADCTCVFPEVEMINNRESTDGIDRYVIKLFDCGNLDDVTVDSNAQRSSTFNLVCPLYFPRFQSDTQPSVLPGQVFCATSLFSRELLIFRTSRQPRVANSNTLIGFDQSSQAVSNLGSGT